MCSQPCTHVIYRSLGGRASASVEHPHTPRDAVPAPAVRAGYCGMVPKLWGRQRTKASVQITCTQPPNFNFLHLVLIAQISEQATDTTHTEVHSTRHLTDSAALARSANGEIQQHATSRALRGPQHSIESRDENEPSVMSTANTSLLLEDKHIRSRSRGSRAGLAEAYGPEPTGTVASAVMSRVLEALAGFGASLSTTSGRKSVKCLALILTW